ncbi:uncharacterized protein LOC130806820 isoform X2 [Amaranthus tricolor]|uniref:uncharacterized protein LOC130806820 isoform X2 n=1 Tax=Amaranthus tricolor TaxID=29722 RepID=UPI002584B1F1|nr:uncharacterized protein LOC130806820 isoform X2 [Amaranthus tricolor]
MNSGKNNGGKSPAPLPMYRPVALKHVPTMVRRRYDPDLRRPTSDGSKNISEAESINDSPVVVSGVDETEVEHDTLASLGTEHDTQINTEEFGSSDFGSKSVSDCELQVDGAHEDGIHAATDLEDSTSNNTLMEHNTLANMDTELVFSSKDFRSISSMNSEDSSKSADDGAKGVNISSSVSTSVENRQDNVHAKSDNEQGFALEDLNDSKSKVDGVIDVGTSVDDTQNNDFRPHTYDSENKSEEAEVWNDPAVVVSNVDDKETEHGLLASFGTQPDTHTYTEEFSSSDFKLNTSMNSEDSSKSADFGAEGVIHTSFVNSGTDYRQDNVHAKSDCDQGLASEDLKDRENEGEKVNYVDTSVDDDAKDDRQKNVFRLNTFLQRLGVHSTHTRLDKVLVWIRKSYDNTNYGNKFLTAAMIATVFYLWRNKKYR